MIFVWEDLNRNNLQEEGEPGIEGVLVVLIDHQSDTIVATTYTNENGYYRFEDLLPGVEYVVAFEQPEGFLPVSQDSGDDIADSDADVIEGRTAPVVLSSGEYNPTIDAGFYRTSSLGDFVWKDLNNNGFQDEGEPGVEDIKVSLYDCSMNLLSETATDEDGHYLFTELAAGDYIVGFSNIPDTCMITTQTEGYGERDSDVDVVSD